MSCMVKHAFASTILRMHVCTVLQQALQHNKICTFAGVVQRSLVKVVASVDVCAMLQQQTNDGHFTTETRSMQRQLAAKS